MEFQLILTTKLNVGRQQAAWQELDDGGWALEVGQGGCVGAAALTEGLVSVSMSCGGAGVEAHVVLQTVLCMLSDRRPVAIAAKLSAVALAVAGRC